MKILKFRTREATPTEADLAGIEKYLSTPLIADYRSLLLYHSGGYLDESNEYFPLKDPATRNIFGDGFILEVLFPLRDDEYPAEELLNTIQCFERRIPSHTIPIGRNAFGDLLLLGIREPGSNAVYLWDHEHEGIAGRKRTHQNIYRVASAFSEFIEELTTYPND